jgi:hypothetical protein
MRREFLAVQEHCLPKPIAIRYSPFAIRHSPSFRLGGSLALPISLPTEVGGYKTKPAKAG